jgi:hypothetical protein
MCTYRQFIVTFILIVTKFTYASDISYDQEDITPQSWQEVDLNYKHKINSKDYIEQAKLLRPTTWLEQYHLDKIGRLVEVHESDVGIDATVKVITLKSSKLFFSSQNNQNSHPVIGTFLKYSDDVWSYTFSNGEIIEATSNHPFYDVEQQQYIPIGNIKLNGDHLLSDKGTKVQLSSKTKHNKGVEAVYNIEVYQSHNYFVGKQQLLVHNQCSPKEGPINFSETARQEFINQNGYPVNHERIVVYRGDKRSPDQILEAGGFYRRTDEFPGIEQYVKGATSSGVSTSTDINAAANFAIKNNTQGYLYGVLLEPQQGIDINSVFDNINWAQEKEMLVLNNIPYKQITDVWNVKQLNISQRFQKFFNLGNSRSWIKVRSSGYYMFPMYTR